MFHPNSLFVIHAFSSVVLAFFFIFAFFVGFIVASPIRAKQKMRIIKLENEAMMCHFKILRLNEKIGHLEEKRLEAEEDATKLWVSK